MPAVRTQDNIQLPANTYVIKIKEMEAGRGDLRPGMLLVMDPRSEKIGLAGEETTEPTFGLPALWVDPALREEATFRGCTVIDPATVLTTHLSEVVKDNLGELLSFAETQRLLDELSKKYQKLLGDLVPARITTGGIQRVLQALLVERVSIRDLPTILEAIGEAAGRDDLGRPLLRVPGLVLRLEPGTVDLPPGACLRLVLPQGLPAAAQLRSEEPLRILTNASGAQERAAPTARALPRPDASFGVLMLRLHEAIRRGEAALLRAKEAPPASQLAEASPERAALREALTELGRLARESLPGGWRVSLLPVVVDDAPTPLHRYLRADHAASANPSAAVRRAVFDLDLSHLGRLQLDVLCQRQRCDLPVRSARVLPAPLRAEVAALFEAAKDVTGLRGELGFHPGCMLALPDPRTPPPGVMT